MGAQSGSIRHEQLDGRGIVPERIKGLLNECRLRVLKCGVAHCRIGKRAAFAVLPLLAPPIEFLRRSISDASYLGSGHFFKQLLEPRVRKLKRVHPDLSDWKSLGESRQEFGVVFVAGCERDLLPLWLPGKRPAHGALAAGT